MRIALFATCLTDTLYPGTAIATVKILERLGVTVDFPTAQSCCGQPQYNTGHQRLAEPLVRRTTAAFAAYDYVVAPSASCIAMIRDNYPRIAARAAANLGDRHLGEAAAELAGRAYDLTEFLTDVLGVTDIGAVFPHTVTYHPACHGLRTLKLGERPRRLLEHVEGLVLRDLPDAKECCGFGGTFAMKNAAVSAAMGNDKVRNALTTGATVLCSTDNSCLMHLSGILRRQGRRQRTLHLAEILASTQDSPWRPA